MPHKLLLIDDEPLNLELMAELLEDAGYQTQTAQSGATALQHLTSDGDSYSTVLLDKMMPGMSGLAVLQQIKDTPTLAFLPVIMQTAVGTAASIEEGLSHGAFYYLTKPFTPEMLLAVVNAAVSHWDRYAHFRQLANQQVEALAFMSHARFTLRSHQEAQWVTALLAKNCPKPDRVAAGLFELLVNAIEHGNFNLDYAEKSRLQAEGRWESTLEECLSDTVLGQKSVIIDYQRSATEISFTITDQGNGFDWQSYCVNEAAPWLERHGRGILIARKLSFDALEYQGAGNQVIAHIHLHASSPGPAINVPASGVPHADDKP